MKKWINKQTIIAFLLGAFLFSGTVGAAVYYQFSASTDSLRVNGVAANKQLYKFGGANYLPLKVVADTLGLDTKYADGWIDLTSPKTGLEKVAENVSSCVLIRVYDSADESTRKLIGTGSGVVIADGIICTNRHVLDAGKGFGIQFQETPDGLEYRANDILYTDAKLDIGFIKCPVKANAVKLGDSDKLVIGEKLVSISSPKGVINVIDECTFSGIKTLEDSGVEKKYVYISDSSMDEGSSGGAIFNMLGELIAVNQGGDIGNTMDNAISINDIKPLLEKIK